MAATNKEINNMTKKAGPPFKDHKLVKSNCGYKLPNWLKDWIRDQDEPAGVLIERVLTKEFNLKRPE